MQDFLATESGRFPERTFKFFRRNEMGGILKTMGVIVPFPKERRKERTVIIQKPIIIIAKCGNTGRRYEYPNYYNIYPPGKYTKETHDVYLVTYELLNEEGYLGYNSIIRNFLFSEEAMNNLEMAYFHTCRQAVTASELFGRMMKLDFLDKNKVRLVACINDEKRTDEFAQNTKLKVDYCSCEPGREAFERCEGTKRYFEHLLEGLTYVNQDEIIYESFQKEDGKDETHN